MNCHNIGHPTAHIVRYLEVLLLSSSYVRMSKYFVHTQSLAGIVLLNLIFGSGGPPARKIKISNTNLFTFHSPFQSQCGKTIFNESFWPCSHCTFYHCIVINARLITYFVNFVFGFSSPRLHDFLYDAFCLQGKMGKTKWKINKLLRNILVNSSPKTTKVTQMGWNAQ